MIKIINNINNPARNQEILRNSNNSSNRFREITQQHMQRITKTLQAKAKNLASIVSTMM